MCYTKIESVGQPTNRRGSVDKLAKVSGVSPENILEVAEAIMCLKGFKDTSLKDIAHAAGISKGTLYYYYSSKENLIYDIAGRHLDEVSSRLLKWIEAIRGKVDPEEILETVLENIIEDTRAERMSLYLMEEILSGNNELKEKLNSRYLEWKAMISKVIGKLFGQDEQASGASAEMLLSLLEGYAVKRLMTDRPFDYGEIAKRLTGMISTGC